MVTNPVYITYISQIADLFCENLLCKASVKSRLKNNLTDASFENGFLPNLDQGRFYVHHFSNLNKRGVGTGWRIDSTFYDLLTNERVAGTWNFDSPIGVNPVTKLSALLGSFGFNIIEGDHTYSMVNVTENRVVHKPSKVPGYGIVFVPSSVGPPGGGLPGPGGSIVIIPPDVPGREPVPEQVVSNFEGYLMPALLIGGGLVLYYFYKG